LVITALHEHSSKVDVATNSSELVSSEVAVGSRAATFAVSPAVSKLNVPAFTPTGPRPVPKEPPPHDILSVVDIVPSLAHLILNVKKLAAQFFACYGSEFVLKPPELEFRNPLFESLMVMPPHAIVYQHLTEAYSAVLHPQLSRSELVKTLEENAVARDTLLNEALYLRE
jgi:hypothetical protein